MREPTEGENSDTSKKLGAEQDKRYFLVES